MTKRFSAKLVGRGPKTAWTFLPVPFDVAKAFGSKGRVAVKGTLNGAAFRKSLMPEGDGTHVMMVSKELLNEAKASAGAIVRVVMEKDSEERAVEVRSNCTARSNAIVLHPTRTNASRIRTVRNMLTGSRPRRNRRPAPLARRRH